MANVYVIHVLNYFWFYIIIKTGAQKLFGATPDFVIQNHGESSEIFDPKNKKNE